MCNYHRPVCVICKTDMRCDRNGVNFVEHMCDGLPYRIWQADRWRCPNCGVAMLIGFGRDAFSYHHDNNFRQVFDQVTSEADTIVEKGVVV